MSDYLLLELDCEGGFTAHLFDRDHGIVVAIHNPLTVSRYDGWVSVVHEAHGRRAETYIPAERFSHLTLLHPIEPEEGQ